MKKVMGWKDYYLILEILTNPSDPIIESDDSWWNPKDPGVDGSTAICGAGVERVYQI